MATPTLCGILKSGTLAGSWTLDPDASSVRLKSRTMWGLVPINGVFRTLRGGGIVSPDGNASGSLTVAAASIDTKNARRDRHLRSADFFDSDNFADITFTAEAILPAPHRIRVAGTLTARNNSHPLLIDAAVSITSDHEIWLDAEIQINRADLGMTWNALGATSMHNTLTIHAVFNR